MVFRAGDLFYLQGGTMQDFHYMKVDVPKAMLESVRAKIKGTCSPACLVMEVHRNDDSYRFIMGVPPAEKEKVESAISSIAGLVIAKATTRDTQQLHQYQEGQAAAEMDF